MPLSQIETASLGSGLVAPTATALTTASGSAPSYSARAWVNFNGTGTVAIRASGNVSSITDNGAGNYTVNFANAMIDVDYVQQFYAGSGAGSGNYFNPTLFYAPSVSSCRCIITDQTNTQSDVAYVNVSIFR